MIDERVAVLYVDARGPYPEIVREWFDEKRDARSYAGQLPIVAHPPCGPWSVMRHLSRETTRDIALHAVAKVRELGGVLEHPRGSTLFRHCGLPLPGELPDAWGGFTIEVSQCDFGHVARKRTWLYVVGSSPSRLPPLPPPREPTHWASGSRTAPRGPVPPGIKVCSANQRRRTPPAFARWLVEAAASCARHPPRMRSRSEARAQKTNERPPAGSETPRRTYNGKLCSVCGHPQFESPGGDTCAGGHGGAPGVTDEEWAAKKEAEKVAKKEAEKSAKVAEISSALREELKPPKPSPFHFPNANAPKVSALRPDLEKVVETIWIDDIHEEWKELEAALQLGEKRSEHAHAIKALDRAAHLAYRAHRLYLTARQAREAWEAENEPIFGAMWSEATRALQAEKDEGSRSKQITDADVRARVATLFPDEFQAQERKRRKAEFTVKSLERLAELWFGRARDLQAIVGKLR